ncbi:MAG: DUF4340 domain-containing protein [Verrucomicrobia bacterium]|nr:DUF4340 domain-containing protein [Verrucomicrobiota bacterium]
MNRKQFLVVLVLVLVLGGAGLLLLRKHTASYSQSGGSLGGKVLGEFDVNAVAQITIKQSAGEVNLAKQGDQWRVRERSDYPANFADLSESLRQLADLKFVQHETVGASFLPRLELTAPGQGTNGASGTLVELKDKDGKLLKSVLLGKKNFKKSARDDGMGGEGFANGRYVMANGDPKQIGLVSDALAKLEAKPENWIAKDFLKLEGIRSVAIVTANETNWSRLSRTNAAATEWVLENAKPGEKLDQNKVSGLGSFLGFGGFNDVKPLPKDLKELGLDKPRVVTVETFDNFKYQFKIGGQTNDENLNVQLAVSANLPKERAAAKDEKPEDKAKLDKEFKEKQSKLNEKLATEKALEGWVFVVSKWNLEAVLKDRPELLEDKKEEKKEDAKPDEKKPDDAK